MERYVIDNELRVAILNYLAGRPWGEVNPIVVALHNASKEAKSSHLTQAAATDVP